MWPQGKQATRRCRDAASAGADPPDVVIEALVEDAAAAVATAANVLAPCRAGGIGTASVVVLLGAPGAAALARALRAAAAAGLELDFAERRGARAAYVLRSADGNPPAVLARYHGVLGDVAEVVAKERYGVVQDLRDAGGG